MLRISQVGGLVGSPFLVSVYVNYSSHICANFL